MFPVKTYLADKGLLVHVEALASLSEELSKEKLFVEVEGLVDGIFSAKFPLPEGKI